MTEDNYRPRSPDFSSLQFPPSNSAQSSYAPLSPLAHRASYDASPFFTQYPRSNPSSRIPQQYVPPVPPSSYDPDMARRSSRLAAAASAPVTVAPEAQHAPSIPEPVAAPPMPEPPVPTRLSGGIEVKTKFPVARIKRIMQADEDVGKVAQVTPIAVCTCGSSGCNAVVIAN